MKFYQTRSLGPSLRGALATFILALPTLSMADVIASADLSNRTVAGTTASNVVWTVNGIDAPSSSLTVTNTNQSNGNGNLFDTTDSTGFVAVANNVGNGGIWETRIDITTQGVPVDLGSVELAWGMFSGTGDLQTVARNATYTIDILDSAGASILPSAPAAELIGTTGVEFFATVVTLGANASYTLVVEASPGAVAGNNTGFSGLTLNGASNSTIKVILQGGQSNSLGRAPSSGLPTSPVNFQQPQEDISFYYNSPDNPGNVLTTLRSGSGRSVTEFGPEVTFGRIIADADPSESYAIIKYANGGSALYNDWAPGTGVDYLAFRDTVANGLAALVAAGLTPEIVGMIWHQGENDAIEGQSSQYQANLTAFIADIRANFGADLPFVAGEIRRSNGADFDVVSDATIAIANSDLNTTAVLTNDLTFFDAFHFDAPSQVTLGERYGNAFLALATPVLPALEVVDIFTDQSGSENDVDSVITYTVSFSRDIDETTVTSADFSNAGTSPITFGAISEISPGVFTVPVTPTAEGTVLLQIPPSASILDSTGEALLSDPAIVDDVTFTAIIDNNPLGPIITGVTIEDVSSEFGNNERPGDNIINGNGFDETAGTHSNANGDGINWINAVNSELPTITFDLEGQYDLNSMSIWNWNTSGTLTAGINAFTVSVADAEGGAFTTLGSFNLAQAPGVSDVDYSETFDLSTFVAANNTRLIRLEVTSNHGFDFNLAGLSEIRFRGVVGDSSNDFASYVSDPAFGLDASEQGFDADPDNDGVPNAVEAFFGTDPSETSEGLSVISGDGVNLVATHAQNEMPPTDLSLSYEWSSNLMDWYEGDGLDGPGDGTVATISPTTASGTTTVTATPSPTVGRFFLRVVVSSN